MVWGKSHRFDLCLKVSCNFSPMAVEILFSLVAFIKLVCCLVFKQSAVFAGIQ